MRRALWHLLCAAAAARAFPRRAEILQNFGVVSRPAAGKKTRPETRPATLRRLRGEGVQRTRLFAYGAKDIEDAATALGPGAKVAVSVPDAEVEAVGRDYADAKRICATIAPAVRAGVVDLIFVGVEPPSGIGADVGRLASLANASRTIAAACAAANATVPVTVAYNLNCLRSSYPPSASLFAAPGPLREILVHLRATGAPFAIQLDPHLAWSQSYYDVSLAFATFGLEYGVDAPQFADVGSHKSYWNLFDAMLDAVRWALAREGFDDLDVVVAKVGWPTGPVDGTAGGGPGGATLDDAARFASRLARHMAGPVGAIDDRPVIAYLYEADDAADAVDGYRWGVCGRSGGLKYSLRTGRVVAPRLRTAPAHPCLGLGCVWNRYSASRRLMVAATVLCVGALAVVAVIVWIAVARRPTRGYRRQSPTRVAALIRQANFKAEENQLAENARRAAAAGSGATRVGDVIITRPTAPLSTVAESPLASDVEDTSSVGSLRASGRRR